MTKRRAKGKAREELVVGAASQAIAELGLANVRVSDVAERAGMSPGHVTYYFPSKTDLLMQAIRQSEGSLSELVAEEIQRIRDPWKRLDKLVELSAANGPGDQGWVLWFEVWSNAALDPDVALVHDELDGRWRAILSDVIRYGCERKAFEAEDPDETARLLSALIDGLSIQLTLGSPGLSRDDLLHLCRAAARAHLGPTSS
ncbi:MAG: TetR/AcrR family transcriptional regulator [Actinomycetota bacterium]